MCFFPYFFINEDYGLETFRKPNGFECETIKKQHYVYLAPELVKTASPPTEYSDVYAFGVILVEIATRGDPYQVLYICMSNSGKVQIFRLGKEKSKNHLKNNYLKLESFA